MNPFSAEIQFFLSAEAVIGVASHYNEATPPVIACLLLPTNSPDDAVCRPLREKLLVAVFRWRNQLYRNPSHYRLQQLLPRYAPEKENIVSIKYFHASFKFVDRSIDGSFVNLFVGSLVRFIRSVGRLFISLTPYLQRLRYVHWPQQQLQVAREHWCELTHSTSQDFSPLRQNPVSLGHRMRSEPQ